MVAFKFNRKTFKFDMTFVLLYSSHLCSCVAPVTEIKLKRKTSMFECKTIGLRPKCVATN